MTRALPALALLTASCTKVPLVDVDARFEVAQAAWFEAERTLFIFYEVRAEQGIGDNSVIELTYRTDSNVVDWTPLDAFPTVHTHVPVDCGFDARCGSISLQVGQPPSSDLFLRLRYDADSELALEATATIDYVADGPPHTSRSLIVYGVFDETNRWIQWRGRHNFPSQRNQEAQRFGLRRWFEVDQPTFGSANLVSNANPYGYGGDCPENFIPTTLPAASTETRAVFANAPLPDEVADAPIVCAQATTRDALGTFTTAAIAQKNPEVRPAFNTLTSPVEDATPLRFFLAPCDRVIDAEHEAMQRQRLLLGDLAPICTDNWEAPGFTEQLINAFRGAIDATRPAGDDMVLVIGIHHDTPGIVARVEDALAAITPPERDRSSPRVVGAFVLDSTPHSLQREALYLTTLWCPARTDAGGASSTCAVLPFNPNVNLGPFAFGFLPILPARDAYLRFIDDYSVQQAGRVTSLRFLAPRFATTTDTVDFGGFGAVSFLDGERFTPQLRDALSYCAQDNPAPVFARTPLLTDPVARQQIGLECFDGQYDIDLCDANTAGVVPLWLLPRWHNAFREPVVELGLAWDFPYLLRMDYRAVVAGSATTFGVTVPFGIGAPAENYYGGQIWEQELFPLEEELLHCTRFCNNPTFDAIGIYQIRNRFRSTYADACYAPLYPRPPEGGFPFDP